MIETMNAVEDKVPLSVILPVFNEEMNIRRALESVSWADDVWVVDSASTDRTAAIARECGANVVQFEYNGTWPKKKNWAMATLPLKHDWMFLLDADEVLPHAARDELAAIVMDTGHTIAGYWINRRFMFMGRWMRHAYYPNWNLRLLRRGAGEFEQLARGPTHSGDNEVHEHLVVRGQTGRLKCEMEHYPFPDVATFVEKHNRYSNWEAVVFIEGGHCGETSKSFAVVDRKRFIKRLAQWMPFRPTLRFLWIYFGQLGFLDGREGYYFARLHAVYERLTLMKIYEMRRGQRENAGK